MLYNFKSYFTVQICVRFTKWISEVPTEMWCVWLLQRWSQQVAQQAASNLAGTVAHCKGPPEPLDSTVFWRRELQQDAQFFCVSFVSQATYGSECVTS